MQTITDPVFVEMNYSHSWKGVCTVPGYGNLPVIVQAYPNETVSDKQRESFCLFMGDSASYLSSAKMALSEYMGSLFPRLNPTNIRPECIIFQQNGTWGFLYPAPNGEDDGFSVRFQDNQIIADTDDALL